MRSYTVTHACAMLGITRVTLHKYLRAVGYEFPPETQGSHRKWIPEHVLTQVRRYKIASDAQRAPFTFTSESVTHVFRMPDGIDEERLRNAIEAIETLQRLHPAWFQESVVQRSDPPSPAVRRDVVNAEGARPISARLPIPPGCVQAQKYAEEHGVSYWSVRDRIKSGQIDHLSGNYWNGLVSVKNLLTAQGVADFHRAFLGNLGDPCAICGYTSTLFAANTRPPTDA